MLLLFLCPGTISVPSCRPSCQMSCCAPPLPGFVMMVSSDLSTTPTTAPMPSCGVDPAPSSSGSGRGTRSSPSGTSRPAPKQKPRLVVRNVAADCRASTQFVLPPPSGSHFQTHWFLLLLLLRHSQARVQKPFFRSRTGFLHALDQRRPPCLHSSGTRTVSSHHHRDWTSNLSS